MRPSPTRRPARTALALLAAVGASALLAGCNSHTSSCRGGTCTTTIKSSSGNYSVELDGLAGGDDTDLTFVSAQAEGDFRFRVNGAEYTCRQGDAVQVEGSTVTCTTVKDNEVSLDITL